ncbi:hypothetical protein L596_027696 [Steinernema carpocapsae]|uniref:PDZ domain-containing protein n=1 Tax=Steinernema carpocapsae TaxID=34508 RepID=A0A4U5LW89_STECR|nr:hypothetical protein L596_027696 [Steinernema carpocapsae]
MASATAVINLELVDDPETPSRVVEENGLTTICLEKGDRGLGFNIVGGSDDQHIAGNSAIFVSKIRPGTAAAASNLREGDCIVAVNGESLAGMTHDSAVAVLRGIPEGNCMLLVEAEAENKILQKASNYLLSGCTPAKPSSNDSPTKTALKSILKKPAESNMTATTMTLTSPDGTNRIGHPLNELNNEAVAREILKKNLNDSTLDNIASSSSLLSEQESIYNGGFIHRHHEPEDEERDSDDSDRISESAASVAPSTTSYYEEIRRNPAEAGLLDPTNPSMLTEVIVVSLGVGAVAMGAYGVYRYFSRR